MEFKVGDIVRVTGDTCSHNVPIGVDLRLISLRDDKKYFKHDYSTTWITPSEIKLIKSNNMNLTEKFALAFKAEPEKTFIKAGVMKADGTLTTDGSAIFMGFLLKKYGADFKKEVVDEIVKNDTDNK